MKTFLLSLATTAILLPACSGGESAGKDGESDSTKTAENLPQVGIYTVTPTDFQNYFEVQGAIEADKNVLVTAETGGLIRSILVEEGQMVNAGQTLVILDSDIIAKSIKEVEKSLELANFVYEKQKNLYDQNIGSELQFQQAKNNKERLEQSLETLKSQQSMSVISAPFSGYVEEVFAKQGEMAGPQVPMIRLLDLHKVKVEADVMETYLKSVDVSKKADIKIDAIDTMITDAKITRVGRYINPANRTFRISIDIPNTKENILPNLVAIVRVKNQMIENAIVVPNESILQSNSGVNYVYIVDKDNVARKVEITPGATDEHFTVVLPNENAREQLKNSDRVITQGARGVKSGMKVKIINA